MNGFVPIIDFSFFNKKNIARLELSNYIIEISRIESKTNSSNDVVVVSILLHYKLITTKFSIKERYECILSMSEPISGETDVNIISCKNILFGRICKHVDFNSREKAYIEILLNKFFAKFMKKE